MKYIVLNPDNTVAYTFPEVDPLRPNAPISDLYEADFFNKCIQAEDDVLVESGYIYNSAAGAFSEPVIEPIEETTETTGE